MYLCSSQDKSCLNSLYAEEENAPYGLQYFQISFSTEHTGTSFMEGKVLMLSPIIWGSNTTSVSSVSKWRSPG